MIALRTRLRRAWAAFWMPLPREQGWIAAWASCGSGSLVSLPPLRSQPDDVTLGFEDAPEVMFPVTRRRV